MQENQDSFILSPNLQKKSAMHFFSVCDGHGKYGSEISSYVKYSLPQMLSICDMVNEPHL